MEKFWVIKIFWNRQKKVLTGEQNPQTRAKLLVLLKDYAGLTYKEISEYYVFEDIRMNSLRSIYRNAKKRGRKN